MMPEVGRMLGITTNAHNFFNEAHPKLRPVETHSAGIYLAGCARAPRISPKRWPRPAPPP
jgi:heterodisulfide reductase subunit A2